MQDVWEAQRQTLEHAGDLLCMTPEAATFEEEMERLAAADIVLVAYPVLSQEVTRLGSSITALSSKSAGIP